ncbi:MAG TPA: hypothetical protein VM012_11435 [Flavitalea sp.]|nr:hypothetical protein [Flavitalea sp.]
MNEANDPLIKEMMMDSKQFIANSAFNNLLMNKIRKHDKRKFILKSVAFYSIPVLCTVILLILFSRTMVRNVDSITLELTAENVVQFFTSFTDKLHLLFVLLLLVIAQQLLSLKVRRGEV